jgi:hypothetical protein
MLLRRPFAGPDLARQWLFDARPTSLGSQATRFQVTRQGRIDCVLLLLHMLASGSQAIVRSGARRGRLSSNRVKRALCESAKTSLSIALVKLSASRASKVVRI